MAKHFNAGTAALQKTGCIGATCVAVRTGVTTNMG